MTDQKLEILIETALKEYRRYRRGKWLTRILLVLVVFAVLAVPVFDEYTRGPGEHTALIDVYGVIGLDADASAERINKGLRHAFEAEGVKGIILRFNTPGGSPVQSSQINAEIDRLQKQHPDIPVYAVVNEICASGGYYIAVAADKIYVDPASIVGSIGVRMDSFGFVKALENLGVERRLHTAGDNKGLFDPFLPMTNEDRDFAQSLLDRIHQQFVTAVKQGRGDRLVEDDNIFSGLIWTGEDARKLGLVDEFGTADQVARFVIKAEQTINYTPRISFLDDVRREFGAAVAQGIRSVFGIGRPNLY